jgi:photosystem II stability/assembly factor-like uncharacterized protein
MNRIIKTTLVLFFAFSVLIPVYGQEVSDKTYSGLKFRNLGPAFVSGRIADIAIHPQDESIMYVAVGSGGVWKTTNAGTTWKPVFDKQTSYSIGCVTIDPNNPATIWVGTGENVGGRHVAFGDGIYVSYDEGESWKNMGLKNSEHLSKIIVHPTNPNVIWVASQGPLWTKGGERGIYKSVDGGKTWKRTLGDAEWVGATDIIIDPRNADVLYAATWQRHRTVAAYMGGGPGTGLHKSIDGGETWTKLTNGIPKSNLGKIGMAISPFNPDVIYADIELDRKTGGLFISKNKGASWTKQSDAVSGGTGPHYYQELYASPHQEGTLFLMNNNVLISEDHGKTFNRMNERNKHVDTHAMAFKMSDPDYVIMGTDGGLYESYDLTKTWRFIKNLPITQYFKVAVDDSEPFYNIYAGTQDNGSHGGPSRTTNRNGISNADWWKTLGADGHQSAIEPGNPDITYGEFQQGALWRVDQTTGESVFIQPQPRKGDPYERFNWDAPILVSPHNPTRLYFASQRVWKSENRGDEWVPISNDLTMNQDRITLPIMGKNQSWDNAWDIGAMSNYNTITSLAESPKQEGLIYAGTDDGIIQITEDGGANWRKLELGSIKGIPATAFVNDVRADLFDAATVYAALDNHKYGDYKPYLIKSTNMGKSWTIINGDLPETLLTWRLVQDHVKKDLLFAATEYGIYFTVNGGSKWIKLTGGIPTISFRDIAIQRRENDLIGASFGRGFFVLDDISPLRDFTPSMMNAEATLFSTRKAYWYSQRQGLGGQGDTEYRADNPPFGAVFTYFMPDKLKSLKDVRKAKEKELTKQKASIPFPGWDAIEAENRQEKPSILLTIKDSDGNVVNVVKGTNKTGFNRVAWNLSYADRSGESLTPPRMGRNFFGGGIMATPGTYSMTLSKVVDGKVTDLVGAQNFEVVPLGEGALKGASFADMNSFRLEYQAFQQDLKATRNVLATNIKVVDAMGRALGKAEKPTSELVTKLYDTKMQLLDLDKAMNGDDTKGEIGERSNPTPSDAGRMGRIALGNTYGPTANHKAAFSRAVDQLVEIKLAIKKVNNETIPALEKELKAAGAPWIEGQGLIDN